MSVYWSKLVHELAGIQRLGRILVIYLRHQEFNEISLSKLLGLPNHSR